MNDHEHLDGRLDELAQSIRDLRAMASETRDVVQREMAQVMIRRPLLDGRLDRLEKAVADLGKCQRETNKLIERAVLFARFVKFTATTAAAAGAMLIGLAGWWAELKATAASWFVK